MGLSADSEQTESLMQRVAEGNANAISRLLELHRPYLKQVVQSRLTPELSPRLDASDIVQETQLVVANRIVSFAKRRPTTFRIWLRQEAIEQVIDHRRRHIDAKKRSVRRETSISDVSGIAIARRLVSKSPSNLVRLEETRKRVFELLKELNSRDREVLSMRHVEGLSNRETADILEIDANTCRQRYGRALRRLHQLLVKYGVELDIPQE